VTAPSRAAPIVALSATALFACGAVFGLAEPEDAPPVDAGGDVDAASPNVTDATGTSDAADAGDAAQRVVFVTYGDPEGDFHGGGIAVADKLCNDEAATGLALVRGRQFVAWLSTPGDPVGAKIGTRNLPYVLPTGAFVASRFEEIVAGNLARPINELADGGAPNTSMSNGYVWTGTRPDGGPTSNDCSGWTTGSGSMSGTVGSIDTTSKWSDLGSASCSLNAPVFCFER
jgi:hypothetical protein